MMKQECDFFEEENDHKDVLISVTAARYRVLHDRFSGKLLAKTKLLLARHTSMKNNTN
jgi:hypothetical protein